MENTTTIILSIVCLLLSGLLVTAAFLWKESQQEVRNKQAQIDNKLAEIKTHEAEINRKEIVIREEKARRRQIAVSYFTETDERRHYFRQRNIIRYKMQLVIDGIPVAQPFTIKEDIYSETNQDNVNKVLDQFAKPLLDMGIQVAVAHFTLSKGTGKLKK